MCNVRPFNQLVPRLPTGDLFGPIYSERALRLFGKGTDARANYEDINGKDVKSLINKDKWNLNTKLYHNKYQLNKKKKVELLQYNEENSKHYRLTDMTEGDDDYNEVLGWYDDYKKKKGEKIAEIKNIIEKLYPDTRPKKRRRSSAAVPPSPTGGDSSSDSD